MLMSSAYIGACTVWDIVLNTTIKQSMWIITVTVALFGTQ